MPSSVPKNEAIPPEKDYRSPGYAALERPTNAEYEAEKQRILREHGRGAMLDFAKEEQFHDYLVEIGEPPRHLTEHLYERARERSDTWRKNPTPFTAEELRELIVSDEELREDPDGARAAEDFMRYHAEQKVSREKVSTRAEALARGEGLSASKPTAADREREPER
jgi:hypothetical protein